jgi:hypothetical protein
MQETKEVRNFWRAYNFGFVGILLPKGQYSELTWSGWAHGHIEREGWFRKPTCKRTRAQKFTKWLKEIFHA